MAEADSSSSTSESEISACSSTFDPVKALYSQKCTVPVKNAPMYETLIQYENSLKHDIVPVGYKELVEKREAEKLQKKLEYERMIEEKNKKRFAQYEGLVPTQKPMSKSKNVLTRMENFQDGPLRALKDCVKQRLRIKVVTRNATGIRGHLHATLVAFDKQWNLALTDVLEVWKRKGPRKRKVPPGLGTPVPRGTAASISLIPEVTEEPLGGGIWECTRYIPQLMIRGEHVVMINVVER